MTDGEQGSDPHADHHVGPHAGPDAPVLPPPPPPSAQGLFVDQLPLAEAYVSMLAGDGVAHGHIGPREVPRLWERHVENSALIADLIPQHAVVMDVGSGAGLPGLPLAIRRPDVEVVLLEPMQRRCDFLSRAVAKLELGDRVTVERGRADDAAVRSRLGRRDWLTARAVAPLDRLVTWCIPLLAPRGRLLALKGRSAATELAAHRDDIIRRCGGAATLVELGTGGSSEPARVVSIQRQATDRRARRRAR